MSNESLNVCPVCQTGGVCEHSLRLLAVLDHQAQFDRNRHRVQAKAVFVFDGNEEGNAPDRWCVEVGHTEAEPDVQGWGPDPLAAALACAEAAFLELALHRGDFVSETSPAVSGRATP